MTASLPTSDPGNEPDDVPAVGLDSDAAPGTGTEPDTGGPAAAEPDSGPPRARRPPTTGRTMHVTLGAWAGAPTCGFPLGGPYLRTMSSIDMTRMTRSAASGGTGVSGLP